MRLTISREAFLAAAQRAALAIPAKDIKPVLKNLKLVAIDDPAPRCTLIATDLEVGIRLDVQGLEVHRPGEALLPAAKLIDVLREARDAQLSLELPSPDAPACLLRGTTSRLAVELPAGEQAGYPDFPAFSPEAIKEECYEITAGMLRELLRRTAFAAADEQARYTMTGVSVELDGDSIRCVATDGRRLALADGIATNPGHLPARTAVLPPKLLALAEKSLADDPEETVRLALRRDDAFLHTSRCVIYSRLLDGRFPDWKGVIPKDFQARAAMHPGALLTAVRQAAVMCDRDGKRVGCKFGPGDLTAPGMLAIEAAGQTAGRSGVEIPLEGWTGEPVSIIFNPDYLTEFLKGLPANLPEGEELVLHLVDGKKPALFRYGKQYQYLVMPLT